MIYNYCHHNSVQNKTNKDKNEVKKVYLINTENNATSHILAIRQF